MQMKLLSAAAALAVAFAGSAYAQSTPSTGKRNAETPKVDRKAKNAEEERIEADAMAAKAKCEPMKGNEKDLCQAEAKAFVNSFVAAVHSSLTPLPTHAGPACTATAPTAANVLASATVTFNSASPGVRDTACNMGTATCALTP